MLISRRNNASAPMDDAMVTGYSETLFSNEEHEKHRPTPTPKQGLLLRV
jgi:hypothetical protein